MWYHRWKLTQIVAIEKNWECGYWIDDIISNTFNLVLTGGGADSMILNTHEEFIAMLLSSRIDFRLIPQMLAFMFSLFPYSDFIFVPQFRRRLYCLLLQFIQCNAFNCSLASVALSNHSHIENVGKPTQKQTNKKNRLNHASRVIEIGSQWRFICISILFDGYD